MKSEKAWQPKNDCNPTTMKLKKKNFNGKIGVFKEFG